MKHGESHNEPTVPPRKGRGLFGRRPTDQDAIRITISRCVEQIADLRKRIEDQSAATQPERLAKLEQELAQTGQGAQGLLSALDSVRSTVAEVTERVQVMERSSSTPAGDGATTGEIAALRADLARLRDEVTAVAADVATLGMSSGASSELEGQVAELTRTTQELARQVAGAAAVDDLNELREALAQVRAEVEGRLAASHAELAAQCTDLPSLRAVVTRLEQDLEMRMQVPVSRLESTVCELDAKVTRALEAAERALWRTADNSDGEPPAFDEMPHEAIRLNTEMEARLQNAIGVLEATRAELEVRSNRALDLSNQALGRVSELSARCAEMPELNARLGKVEVALVARLQEEATRAETARAEFEGRLGRAVQASEQALARTDLLAARYETVSRVEGEVRLLEERLTSLVRSLQHPAMPTAPPAPGIAELVATMLTSLRSLLPSRVRDWLGVASA